MTIFLSSRQASEQGRKVNEVTLNTKWSKIAEEHRQIESNGRQKKLK